MDYQKIGTFIAKKRKEKNLTQKALASLIGVTDKAVSKWERGLGCPDISLLDILSKVLDVSILDILNGQEVVDEYINTKDAKNNIENIVNNSKIENEKLKKFISKILVGIILSIGALLIILNIINIKNLNKKTYFDEGYETLYNSISKKIDKLNSNINIIKNNKGIYKEEDYNEILKNIDSINNNISSFKLLKYYDNKSYIKQVDINYMAFNVSDFKAPSLVINNLIKILKKYDDEFNNKSKTLLETYYDTILIESYLSEVAFNPISFYYYQLDNNVYEIDNINYDSNNFKLNSILYSYIYTVDSYNYLIEYIIG